ncbi:WD40-repeat-containing domain protein, partial [Thelephora terrestris]
TISALEFSPDGKVLASGCEDGSVTIFSTLDWKPLQTFIDASPSTSLVWHPQVEGLLFCGFRSGDVHTLQTNRPQRDLKIWTDKSPGPVHCLTHDSGQNVLALGSGKDVVLTNYSTRDEDSLSWYNTRRLPPPPSFIHLHTSKHPDQAAQSVHFLQEPNSVVVSYLHHGITCWDRNSLSLVWQITPRSCQIGRSCLSTNNGTIAVTNLFDGVDWYSIKSQRLVDSFRMLIEDNIVAPIIFDGTGSWISGGSCGAVRVICPFPAIGIETLELEGE